MKNKSVLVILGVLLFAGCMTLEDSTEFDHASLYGKIYDLENMPCSGVSIMVDDEEQIQSDINGRFIIKDLSQGAHTMIFTKKGYKTETVNFEFLNKTQVLWQQMVSVEQVIPLIKKALDEMDWNTAADHLKTGMEIDESNPIVNYLYAMYYYKLKDYPFAIKKLEALLDKGYKEAYVYMALTDIYEYQYKDYQKAYDYLEKYLEQKDDKESRLRLKVLESRLTTQ